MIIAKCTSCHHEVQMMNGDEGQICSWCRQGTLLEISPCPEFDPYKFLGKLRKFGRNRP